MILICTNCHLPMVKIEDLVFVCRLDRPRDVLIPVEAYVSRMYDCPGCGYRVTVSLDPEQVAEGPGYPLSKRLHAVRSSDETIVIFAFPTARDMREGLDLGFRDQYPKSFPIIGAAGPPDGPPKLKTE